MEIPKESDVKVKMQAKKHSPSKRALGSCDDGWGEAPKRRDIRWRLRWWGTPTKKGVRQSNKHSKQQTFKASQQNLSIGSGTGLARA